MLTRQREPSLGDLEVAFGAAGCLGPWLHEPGADRLTISQPLARLLGLGADGQEIAVPCSALLAGIHDEDRLRIDSVLHEAIETGLPFEAEFRTRPGGRQFGWIRLMGRSQPQSGMQATRGLAFDLTEARRPAGPAARRAHRQANQLAEHVIAMKGLAAESGNARLHRLLDDLATETGYELARRLILAEPIGRS